MRAPFPWCLAKPCAPCLASMIRVSISRETAQGRSKTGEEVRPCVLGGIGPFSSERRATAPMTRRRASLRHWRICKMAAQKGSPGLQSVRRKNTRRKGEQRAATSQHLQPARARRCAGHARVARAHWRRQPQPRAKHFFPVKMCGCAHGAFPRDGRRSASFSGVNGVHHNSGVSAHNHPLRVIARSRASFLAIRGSWFHRCASRARACAFRRFARGGARATSSPASLPPPTPRPLRSSQNPSNLPTDCALLRRVHYCGV